MRTIFPKREYCTHPLSAVEKAYNKDVSSDRVIVENFFGRQINLWGLMAKQWHWNESSFDMFSKMSVAVTNFHVLANPLRQGQSPDYLIYNQYKNRLAAKAEESVVKRSIAQQHYRSNRKRRLQAQMYGSDTESDDDDDDVEDLSADHVEQVASL